MVQLAPLARGVDGVAADAGVLGALAHGEPDLHTALRPGPRSRTSKRVVMGITFQGAPGGAVPVTGAGCWCGTSIKPWAHVCARNLVSVRLRAWAVDRSALRRWCRGGGALRSTGDASRIGPCENAVNLNRATASHVAGLTAYGRSSTFEA